MTAHVDNAQKIFHARELDGLTVVCHLVVVVGLKAPTTQKISKIWRQGAN